MLFKSLSVIPPGGWSFRQPQTGWPAPEELARMKLGYTFDQWVKAIQLHREANPRFKLSTDPEVIAGELEWSTALRIKSMKGADQYLMFKEIDPRNPPKTMARSPEGQGVAGIVAENVGKISAGVQTIINWLGSGGNPVSQETAEARAAICVACPENRKSHWLEWAKDTLASSIKSQIGAKLQMQLLTSQDSKLMTCNACLCWLPLKVWCPIDHIADYTTPEIEGALDKNCWFFKERDEWKAQN